MRRLRLRRVFWIGAAAVLAAAALIALVDVARGRFSETDGRIILTLLALLYAGAAGLAGLALLDRGTSHALGRTAAAAAPLGLAFMTWGVWSFVWEAGETVSIKLGWSWAIGLAAGLVATTGLLLAQSIELQRLAWLAGALAALAAALSVAGVWSEPSSDTFAKVVVALWIVTALAYFLVPILQRFTAAGQPSEPRVLAELDGVELVATRAPADGVAVEGRPRAGERLVLRKTGSDRKV